MICYRDMTFCEHYETCKNAKWCSRPLTPEVKEQAKKWWGDDDAPIARFVNKPECHTDFLEVNQIAREEQERALAETEARYRNREGVSNGS